MCIPLNGLKTVRLWTNRWNDGSENIPSLLNLVLRTTDMLPRSTVISLIHYYLEEQPLYCTSILYIEIRLLDWLKSVLKKVSAHLSGKL